MKLLLGGTTLGTIVYVFGVSLIVACGGSTFADSGNGGVQGGAAGAAGATASGGAAGAGATGSGGAAAAAGATASGGAAGSGAAAGSSGAPAQGGAAGSAGAGGAGSVSSCVTAADCAWGEIGHEITKKTDCMCLFGCPSLIQNKTTVERRKAQYAAFCDPRTDGQGNPCPIDDCMMPPALACVQGQCVVPSVDAGAGGTTGAGGAAGAGGALDAGGARRCGRAGDAPCATGQFCELAGVCGEGNVGGTCLNKPSMCSMIYAPVCGCNNVTYGNDCSRQAAGQSKFATGACTSGDL